MRFIVDAKRWEEVIDSKDVYPDVPVTELRIVQREDGQWLVFVNGSDEPSTLIEPAYGAGGERIWLYGDREEPNDRYIEIV
jgi:hypothetical protein